MKRGPVAQSQKTSSSVRATGSYGNPKTPVGRASKSLRAHIQGDFTVRLRCLSLWKAARVFMSNLPAVPGLRKDHHDAGPRADGGPFEEVVVGENSPLGEIEGASRGLDEEVDAQVVNLISMVHHAHKSRLLVAEGLLRALPDVGRVFVELGRLAHGRRETAECWQVLILPSLKEPKDYRCKFILLFVRPSLRQCHSRVDFEI